ncbi:MAG TPA: S-layer protein, partial [Pirellulales bacterium]|nr:S-layer protein [Pirellulales bacterium]
MLAALPLALASCLSPAAAADVARDATPSGQTLPEQTLPEQTLNFTNDVLPLLTKHGCNSGGCHGRGSGQNGFKLSLLAFDPAADYAALADEGLGRRVSWTAPDESLMLLKATGQVAHGGGVRFERESSAYQLLRQWIAQGTPWGDEKDPALARIAVEPPERLLSPGETLPLRVTAHYSDGSTRDVTATAEYFSQQPAHLEVSGEGQVRALDQRGDAAITVRYMGIVAIARLAIPFRQDLPEQVYAGFQPKSFVDQLALEKWRKLGLAPSPAASDAEFLRRA